MMKKGIILGILVLAVILISACSPKGSIVILEDGKKTGFTMEFNKYNSENKCELSLKKNDVVKIEVDREDGEIAFSINGKNKSQPYTGNSLQPGMFTITIFEEDDYVFTIKGKNATGKIEVKNLGKEQ